MKLTQFSYQLLAPRYWLWWLGMGMLWNITRLPLRWQLGIGKFIGITGYYLAARRRHIAAVNIRLCFPELSATQQQTLVKRHFASLGMGLLEMLNAWWSSDARLEKFGQIQGLEHLQQALARGHGVILLSAHFTSLEIATRFLIMHLPVHATYRPHENPVVEYWMQKNRTYHADIMLRRQFRANRCEKWCAVYNIINRCGLRRIRILVIKAVCSRPFLAFPQQL